LRGGVGLRRALHQPRERAEDAGHAVDAAALEVERGRGHVPAAVLLADHVLHGDAHVLEEGLVEAAASCIWTIGRTEMPGVSMGNMK
jgi:hypothetical protein